MLLQSVAMVVKQLLVDNKITACVKHVCWVLYVKFQKDKNCLEKHFALLKNVCKSIIKFCDSSNLLFLYELLIGPQPTFLECIVNFLESDWSTLSKWPRLRQSQCKL